MKSGLIYKVMIFIFASCVLKASANQASCQLANYCLENPFSVESLTRLQKMPGGEKFQGLDKLLNVKKVMYKIEPLASCPSDKACPEFCPEDKACDQGIRYKQVIFTVYYGMSESFNNIANAFTSQNFDNCSYGRADVPSHTMQSKDSITFKTHISYATRVCAGLLGTHDLVSASADAEYPVSLNHAIVDYENSDPNIGPPVTLDHGNLTFKSISGSFFGVPLQMLGMSINFALAPVFDRFINDILVSEGKKFMSNIAGLDEFSIFTQLIKELKINADNLNSSSNGFPIISFPYQQETGFFCEKEIGCTFNIAMRYIMRYEFIGNKKNKSDGLEGLIQLVKTRINLIKDLRDTPLLRIVVINKGDTLGNIAKKEYGNHELYLFLLAFNTSIKNFDKVKTGIEITVPSILCAYKSFYMKSMINNNDSLWKRWKNSDRHISWNNYKRVLPGSVNAEHIYPSQIDLLPTKEKSISSLCPFD